MDFDIEIPTEDTEVVLFNPATLGFFGRPKSGKTTAVLSLEDCLTIELEERGADFAKGRVLKIPKGLNALQSMEWLVAVAKKIKADGHPYKYIAIDTLTKVDEWSEWAGTLRYMKTEQGKDWNRWKKEHPNADKRLKRIPFGDEEFESIHTQGQGYGFRWSRAVMVDMYKLLSDLGSVCTIFIMHVAVNKDANKINGDTEVGSKGLALTGAVKDIIARELDAIAYLYHEDGKTMVNFQQNEEKVGGMRGGHHLRGYNGPLDWDKIFTK